MCARTSVDHITYQTSPSLLLSFFFFFLPATPRLSGPQKLNQHFAKVSETTTATKKE